MENDMTRFIANANMMQPNCEYHHPWIDCSYPLIDASIDGDPTHG